MLHVREPTPDWLRCVPMLPTGALVKAVSVQWLSEAKAAKFNINTALRYVNDGLQDVNPDDTDAIREARARDWFNRFIDGTFLNGSTAGIPHWQATNFVSWWNEYYADSQSPQDKELWWRQERVAARIWRDEYRNGPNAAKLGHIRLAICATAVGNNIPVQSAQTAVQYDCVLDYHPYSKYLSLNQRDPLDWQYHSGRWVTMDNQFRAAGYTVRWLFGEAGPYESAATGWRHDRVLDGNVQAYAEWLRWWIQQIKTTHTYQTNRIYGFALFTTGGGSQWQWFETRQPELDALAGILASEWNSNPPPPNPCRGTPRVQYNRAVHVLPSGSTNDRFVQVANAVYPERQTVGFSYDDAMIGDLNSRRAILWDIPLNERAAFLAWRDQHYPGVVVEFREPGPLHGLQLGHIFQYRYVLTSPFDAPRNYGNGKHEGTDYDVIGGQANNTVPVLCTYPGVVDISSDSTGGYGKYVRVRHVKDGFTFFTRYAHLDARYVTVGQQVAAGHHLGEVGATGNANGEHVHLNLEVPVFGLTGYVVDRVVNPEPYMAPGRSTLPLL